MSNLAVVQPVTFKQEGFIHEYPVIDGYKSSFLGYSSDMVNLALQRDDPEAFVHFMRLAGCNKDTITFDGKTMGSYCDKRNAARCKAALERLV